MVECLPRNLKALSTNPSTSKKINKEKSNNSKMDRDRFLTKLNPQKTCLIR
jgi:hypothetical protein